MGHRCGDTVELRPEYTLVPDPSSDGFSLALGPHDPQIATANPEDSTSSAKGSRPWAVGHPDGTGWTRVTVELWETRNTAKPETNSPTGSQQSLGMD